MNTTSLSQTRTIDDRTPLRAPLLFALVVLLGFGLLYCLAGTALGRLAFPWQATGSLALQDGKVRGSTLVAQPFADARYFQPRPSAANYDPMAAAGSNLARTNPDLRKRMAETAIAVAERDGIAVSDVPAELITQSGGGLDPHLSPRAAQVQVARVAKARGLSAADVDAMVVAHTLPRQFGLLGEPRVNVLELNLALDARR
ncbi:MULTISPECIES: potassium-transporting ATPase subunit KdpC [unclassified Lysobacter]|uniref:potassium-transporting ATPase subunit KdpC n=1 Tax=unclassified Lysobacter TaxID=2635362 RepID=UPI000700AA78|nr:MULTISPECIES: potassium-transporting ATPase subunit KdpC [unclassified Lysobacter]KRC38271.1 potassium-transporting ATPase subunit C [Lysobacter sp. Root76]KRD69595.1 potassium-transporting ATPase subunit C [Lysobacter sp. Root96]